MIVGTATVEIHIPESASLKMKRSIVKRIRERIRRKFNVSIAEIDHLDKWQRSTLGIGIVSNQSRFADQVLAKVVREIEAERALDVLSIHVEMR
ncbi:MAG: DUF503 domain-containing protein [Candidatus Eisenbacteria sp.]|nr:DUF503 domain-containing protein [Candidatus Eisenbacteria bacterium]